MMQLDFAYQSDIGSKRDINQDAYAVFVNAADVHFFLLADGVTGGNAGEVASQSVIDFFTDTLSETNLTDLDEIYQLIIDEGKSINSNLRQQSSEDDERSKMATTFIALVINEQQAMSINLGDSRAYRFTDNHLLQLSQDHTLVDELIQAGAVESDNAANVPNGDQITRYFGAPNDPEFDHLITDYNVGDQFLVTSDGLTKQVDLGKVANILASSQDLDVKVHELIDSANNAGGLDNVTSIIIEVRP